MRDLLFINARIVDPDSGRDGLGWAYIRDNKIADIDGGAHPGGKPEGVRVINGDGLVLAPALIDVGVQGDLFSGEGDDWPTLSSAAAAGGVGTIVLRPSLSTPLDTPERINAAMGLRGHNDPRLAVVGGLLAETGIAELAMMRELGSLAAYLAPERAGDLKRARAAMTYASSLDLPIIAPARERRLEAGSVAHDGETAARFGLPGAPAIAEQIAAFTFGSLGRDVGANTIISDISTAHGLSGASYVDPPPVIAAPATALFFNDVDTASLDPGLRIVPPIRDENDRMMLRSAVASRVVSIITSNHCAIPARDKLSPFADAAPGAPGLETLLSALLSLAADGEMTLAQALYPVTTGPARTLGLASGRCAKGAPADLVLFDPRAPWVCKPEGMLTSATTTPFAGRKMIGRVRLTVAAGRVIYDELSEEIHRSDRTWTR